jgi:hypothetical protein
MLRRWSFVLQGLAVILLTLSCTSTGTFQTFQEGIPDKSLHSPENIPAKYLESVRLSIEEAGENRPELIKVMTKLTGRELEWACFLIGTMPFSDLISIKADYLSEHIHYTSLAMDKYKWMLEIPEDVFLAYILPYRISSEPIVPHRRYFFEQLDPLVANGADMFEISYQVNLWLGGERKGAKARVHFEPGEARNKSPFGTLLSGQGRCGELTIALVSALRAVGVPARSVYTPSWVKSEDNHAWTEIWAGGKWYAMASGHPSIESALAATAGRAWFIEPAATAAAIYSERFGTPEDQSFICKATKKDSIISVLSNYSETCKLDITVLATDDKAASDTFVALSVVNGGAFRKVALQKTDTEGKATIYTGIGQYMLSAGNGDMAAWQIVTTTPAALPVTLTLAKDNTPSGYYVLEFPNTHAAYIAFNPAAAHPQADMEIQEKYKLIGPERSPEAPLEKYCYEKFRIEEHPEINALIGENQLSGSIVGVMELAGGNWPEIASAITKVPENEKEDLLWLISTLTPVDSVEVTKEILLEHVHYAQLARKDLPVQISDDVYRSYVLSPHMPYMHVYQWRKELYDRFVPVIIKGEGQHNIANMALYVNKWIEQNMKLVEVMSGRFISSTNPAAVFRSKRTPSSGPILATVAALRSTGIPARVKSTWLEFFNGSDWAPFYPMDSQNLGNREATEASKREYAKKGGVMGITTRNGSSFSPGRPNWGIARFSDGGWDYLKDEFGNGWASVTPGKYLFTAAARNKDGNVLVYARPITVLSGKGTEITVPLDLPVEMLSNDEHLDRKLKNLNDLTLETLENRIKTREVDLAGLDYAEKGFEYLTSGDYPRAVEYYRMATDASPDISEIWYNYACALSRNNNVDEAFDALRKVIEFGYENFAWMIKDPDLENLRKDKRFEAIVKRRHP